MKHFIALEESSPELIDALINRTSYWKKASQEGVCDKVLANKVVGMIFEKPSTRTRVSFEVAVARLGGAALFMNSKDLQLSRNEPIKDTARVLGAYLDALVIRTYQHAILKEFIQYSNISIINGLSDQEHPCQTIADLMTMKEVLGDLAGKKIVYTGRYNNVSYSLMLGALKMGMEFSLLVPTGDYPDKKVVEQAQGIAKKNQGKLLMTQDLKEAMEGSSVVYTDVWESMGDEKKMDRVNLMCYQVSDSLLKHAGKDVKVMHCLPAKRGEEITEAVLEGHQSIVFQQAENKLYAHMAILEKFLN